MSNTKKKKERVAIYIDGSNFFNYLKDKEVQHKKGSKFNYNKFAEFLRDGRELISKRYYIGIVKNIDDSPKSKRMVKSQQKFLSYLKNIGYKVKRGRIIYDSGKTREKGTDVKIAVDLIMGAVDDLYDTAILVSSDTDIIPAVKTLHSRGKKVEYVGFRHSPSYGLKANSDKTILLTASDIKKFIE